MTWKKEFDNKFIRSVLMYGTDDIKDFIEELIKEKDEEIEKQKQRAEYHWDRTGNSKVFLLLPNKDNPFYRTECKIADFGVSDNHYIVECDEIEALLKETALKCKAIGQRTIKDTDDWRNFANEIETEFGITMKDTSDGEIYSKISLLDRLKQDVLDANNFIKEIGKLLLMDTDNWGKDGITASVDDFKVAIEYIKKAREDEHQKKESNKAKKDLLEELEQCYFMDMGLVYEVGIENFEELKKNT